MTVVTKGLLKIIVDGKVKQKIWTERNGGEHYVKVRDSGEVRPVSQEEFEQIVRRRYPGKEVEFRYR